MKPRIKSYKSDRKRAVADHKLRVAESYKADAVKIARRTSNRGKTKSWKKWGKSKLR
jgi:hypothetical protein